MALLVIGSAAATPIKNASEDKHSRQLSQHGGSQAEVVLEVSEIGLSDIEELGGYSSTIDDLSPLQLAPSLQAVICRSSAERQLLLHELGEHFPAKDRIRVFNEAGVFNADYAFVETVDLAKDGVHVKFHCPRRGSLAGKVRVQVTSPDVGIHGVRWENPAIEFWKKWTFTYPLQQGNYLVEIWIRDCLAYRAKAILADDPF